MFDEFGEFEKCQDGKEFWGVTEIVGTESLLFWIQKTCEVLSHLTAAALANCVQKVGSFQRYAIFTNESFSDEFIFFFKKRVIS